MSNAVPQTFKLPLIDSDQNTCAFCGTHVVVELSVGGKHTGQYYVKVRFIRLICDSNMYDFPSVSRRKSTPTERRSGSSFHLVQNHPGRLP